MTVDNASSNDTALTCFKKKWEADLAVTKVREAVKYIRNSPARLKKFKDTVVLLEVEAQSGLCLDVQTRWNSTYLMLQSALIYQKVFDKYEDDDLTSTYVSDLGEMVPQSEDWEKVQSLVVLLKCFYEMTIRISGSLYVTANNFFSEISDLSCMLADMMGSEVVCVQLMGKKMKAKFEKYWGDPDKMNKIIFYANILDPRDKSVFMPVQFKQLYGDDEGETFLAKVLDGLKELYGDYVVKEPSGSQPFSTQTVQPTSRISRHQSRLKSQLKRQRLDNGEHGRKKNELEIYLSEAIVEGDEDSDFDVLLWWKRNSERFPTLSKLARDILAVPISTVASESAFSTSGRVLDPFISSLTPKMVEALICAQDWMRLPNKPILVEENIDTCEKFEKELTIGDGVGSPLPPIPVNISHLMFFMLFT